MVWFRVEPTFPTHPKFMRIPRAVRLEAIGLWTVAGAWSAQQGQDGRIPAYMVDEWGPSDNAVAALVTVGLWDETDDGYAFHDWSDYQFTRAEIAAHRESERRRKEAWRQKRAQERENTGQSPGGTDGGTPGGTDAGQTDLSHGTSGDVPPLHMHMHSTSRHVTTDERPAAASATASGGPKKERTRGTRLPDPFLLTAKMREWAGIEVPLVDVDRETKVFVDYWRSVAGAKGVKIDWVSTWRNSMRRKQEMLETAGGAARVAPPDEFAAKSNARITAWLTEHGVTRAEYQGWVDEHGYDEADRRVAANRKAAK